jgi:regulator of protease activity HflC (stomatin/prohibitin superfamily)
MKPEDEPTRSIMDQLLSELFGGNLVILLLALFIILCLFLAIRIVPQSEQHVVERFGRLKSVLGPGINFIVPFLDRVAHKVSILERQLPNASQDAITADNVLVQIDTSVFYRILEPEKTVYRIRDVDGAIATTVAGIVRAEIGKMELDEVQSNRSMLIPTIKASVEDAVDDWGIEVTRAEILDVNLDQATRDAMLQQLNAERERRAAVTRAEGQKRAVELQADGELYAARQAAEARRVEADAEAYATGVVAEAIAKGGLEAVQYNIALEQVKAIGSGGSGAGVADDDRAGGCGRCLRQGVPDAERARLMWSEWWVWGVAAIVLAVGEVLSAVLRAAGFRHRGGRGGADPAGRRAAGGLAGRVAAGAVPGLRGGVADRVAGAEEMAGGL